MASPNYHYYYVLRILKKLKEVAENTYQLDDEYEEKILGTIDTDAISTLLLQEKDRVLKPLERMEEKVEKSAKLEEGLKLEPVPGDWGKSITHTLVGSTDE